MKILFVSNTSWYLYNFRLRLMESLIEKGNIVIVAAPYDECSEKLKKKRIGFIPIELDRKKINPTKDLKFFWRLYNIYKKEKPDLVLHHTLKPNICGAVAAKIAKIKCINNVTGLGWVFMRENVLFRVAKLLCKFSFNFCEKVFLLNEDDLRFFERNKILNKSKSLLIKEGVNTSFFHPDSCEKFNKSKNFFIFLFIGRLLWDKGVGEFINAARILKRKYLNAQFWLLGPIDKGNPSGIPEEKVKEWQQLGLIKYLGMVEDVRPFICQSDVVVSPSFYREGIPRSLLEAASMGKPLIATNFVGCKEIVDHGINGFLVPIKDSKALANAMMKMIEIGEDKRKQMGKAGRQKILTEFDEKILITKYLGIIDEIANLKKTF